MAWIFYMVYSVSLFLWTTISVPPTNILPVAEYVVSIVLLAIALLIVNLRFKKLVIGVMIAAIDLNIGFSIIYRLLCELDLSENGVSRIWFLDIALILLAFGLVYYFVRFTNVYKRTLFQLLAAAALPIMIFLTKAIGTKPNEAYLDILGILMFGVVLMVFPFVASWILYKPERYLHGNVKKISFNCMELLIYTLLLDLGCALCNEYGLFLILTLITSALFFLKCKDTLAKVFYSLSCGAGALIIAYTRSNIRDRVAIWLNPAAASGLLREKAESVLYLFRHIKQMGFWGQGIGNLPQSFFPSLGSDYALLALLNDYSVWMLIVVFVLSVFLIRWMLMSPVGLCTYDRCLNLTCALIVGFIMLIDIGSVFGSFITVGIGFPWVSGGSIANAMLTGLLAVHCGLLNKRKAEVKNNAFYEEEAREFVRPV